MKLTRRQVAQFGLMGLGALGISPLTLGKPGKSSRTLRVLILGGTGFLGPHIVRYAASRGHTVTLFNRGKTDTHLFPELEKLKGNRGGDLKALMGRKWDLVIDTSSSIPKHVTTSVSVLRPNVDHYIYVSSTSVYRDWTQPGMDETAPVYSLKSPDAADFDPLQRYGANKAMCESIVRDSFGEGSAIIRPNTIEGAGLRKRMLLPYWVRRATQGGETLGPGAEDDSIQYIDVRDLAEWLVHCAENSVSGTFNASSSPGTHTMKQLIDGCQSVTGTTAPIVWIDNGFLREQGHFSLPYWVHGRDKSLGKGHMSVDLAMKNGLKQRPKIETTGYIYDWLKTLTSEERAFNAGIPREFEKKVIANWKASRKPGS